jgi:hypothetical protein
MAKTGEGAGKTNYPQRDVASDPVVETFGDAGDLSSAQPLGAVMPRASRACSQRKTPKGNTTGSHIVTTTIEPRTDTSPGHR